MTKMNIKVNDEKLYLGQSQYEYFGHVLSADGIKPDPKKATANKDMKPPENRYELDTVLGMVNYLSKFAPNLVEITSPMRQLHSKRSNFCLTLSPRRIFCQCQVHNYKVTRTSPCLLLFLKIRFCKSTPLNTVLELPSCKRASLLHTLLNHLPHSLQYFVWV